MRLLLDTHVLLWWIDGDPRVSERSHALSSDAENAVSVSVASVWEIAIKAGLGQLEVPPDLQGYLRRQLARNESRSCQCSSSMPSECATCPGTIAIRSTGC